MKMTELLATVTIVTFVAATGVSLAQQERGAPAEKIAPPRQPSTQRHQNGAAQNAAAGRDKRSNGRVGQAPQHRGRAETTGQAPTSSDRNLEQGRVQTEQRLNAERSGRNRTPGQASRHDRLNRETAGFAYNTSLLI
jgi:hypothetical protein